MSTAGYIFNEGKAAEAALYLLSLNDGKLAYMKLIKLLYIADRISLSKYHASITTSSYYSMKLGPVTSEILDRIKHPSDYARDSYWNRAIRTEGYNVIQQKEFVPWFLSENEMETLEAVDRKYKNGDQYALSEITHSFAEWRNPGDSSIPITIDDILSATIEDEKERARAMEDIGLSAHLQNINYISMEGMDEAKGR